MSRPGPMSLPDHRAWVALHGGWEPPVPRPDRRTVDRTMARLAAGLGRSEAELIDEVTAAADFTELECVRLESWAREALTIVVLAAQRAAYSGTALTQKVLFHELATRFSPTYAKALETTPARVPSEMKYVTLVAARDDLKNAGLRLQQLFDYAKREVKDWYAPRRSAGTWRVRANGTAAKASYEYDAPLNGAELDEKRAEIGLPPLERAHSNIMRAEDLPRSIYRRIETADPVILEAERVLGRDVLLAIPPSLDSYTLVGDAHVTGEVEYEPIRSGKRSRDIVDILNRTRLWLNVQAVRDELARLERAVDDVKQELQAVLQPRRRVGRVTKRTVYRYAGSAAKVTYESIEIDGRPFLESRG